MHTSSFSYVDLFAGIGGFHALLGHSGGECVFASELDVRAAAVYEANWQDSPKVAGDLTQVDAATIPSHDVLAAGFPCQAFSKSGLQRGIHEARGTLFYEVLRVLEYHRPPLIMLENVRNLAGPRHRDTWRTIIRLLRGVGYRVSSQPTVFSPHFLPPSLAGTPQIRDRVYILGTYVGEAEAKRHVYDVPAASRGSVSDWQPKDWNLFEHLIDLNEGTSSSPKDLTDDELTWIEVWDDFVQNLRRARGGPLPGFPLWFNEFRTGLSTPEGLPDWKRRIVLANRSFYAENQAEIDKWAVRWAADLAKFPASRLKLEWQAHELASLWDCALQLRPSGIRAKEPNYLPALVAMAQTPIIGPLRRKLSVREGARLQGLPDWFNFGTQPDAATFRQLGNGLNVGAAWWVLRAHVTTYQHLLPAYVASAVLAAPAPTASTLRRPSRRRPAAA